MTEPNRFVTTDEFEAELATITAAPSDDGELVMIIQRPATDGRVVLSEGSLNTDEGLAGDNWNQRPSSRTPDGGPHPEMQLTLMNVRVLRFIADADPDRMIQAGDQLIVDLDLSDANLPAGTRLAVGDAVVEVTAEPHTGCAKFTKRFGGEAHRFVNSEKGRALNLRGINARVVTGGAIHTGDRIKRI